MDENYDTHSVASGSLNPSTLNDTMTSLRRLDDKLATGMSISDMAQVRWLTDVEVLQYLDQAASVGEGMMPELTICTKPPSNPPTTGTLLLYSVSETPNYAEDGIEWIREKGGAKWMNIAGVLAGDNIFDSSSSASKSAEPSNVGRGRDRSGSIQDHEGHRLVSSGDGEGSSSKSSSAMRCGAVVEYLTSAKIPTFHRREYRGPNDIVLLQYLDSVRALRMTSELVDRIIELSTGSNLTVPSTRNAPLPENENLMVEAGAAQNDSSGSQKDNRGKKLDGTMDILFGMVNEHDAGGTSTAEANDDNVLDTTTDAALSSLLKHVSPDEAMNIVDAMELAMEIEGDVMTEAGILEDVNDLTEFDIDEAIDQVLTGSENEATSIELEGMLDGPSEEKRGAAAIIEDRILASLQDVISDELRIKLVKTTETLLNVAGVDLTSRKGEKRDTSDNASVSSGRTGSSASYEAGSPLPEIIDITPDFHVSGYHPPKSHDGTSKEHVPTMVLSTSSPIPDLPPYVDPYSNWVMFACFIDFVLVSRDPTVRNISFQRLTPLTPYSYKCSIPRDIPEVSTRHIIIAGVLLPKNRRKRVPMVGIELALKLSIQTEWFAAADIVRALKHIEDIKPLISGNVKPLFVVPCGGTRMQLLSQISNTTFTMYPGFDKGSKFLDGMMPTSFNVGRSSFANDGGAGGAVKKPASQKADEKRKREGYLQEWASLPGNDLAMTNDEVDRHRKIRFVERMTNVMSDSNTGYDSSGIPQTPTNENAFDGGNMNDAEIDALLGQVLMRYVEVAVEKSTDEHELCREVNSCGYSGLALLHHAAIYNFQPLATLLLSHNADPDVTSLVGKLTPLHFAAASGHKEIVNLLLRSGCNPFPIDAENLTPADHATKAGHVEIAKDLDSHIQQSGLSKPSYISNMPGAVPAKAIDVLLQSAFKELSLKDKLGLNLFASRGKSTEADDDNTAMESCHATNFAAAPSELDMNTDGDEGLESFAFISEEDRIKLRAAMSLANEMDLDEMNRRAANQNVCRYLRKSNYEAIKAASKALDKANKKESDALKGVKEADDPSKMQLSRALAMLVLRKNLPPS